LSKPKCGGCKFGYESGARKKGFWKFCGFIGRLGIPGGTPG
jgi:hypothetical protein